MIFRWWKKRMWGTPYGKIMITFSDFEKHRE
jgi:hypothetical protein